MVNVSVAVEIVGNTLAAVALGVGLFAWRAQPLFQRVRSLRVATVALIVFALTNVFYGIAYFLRQVDVELFDTFAEVELVRPAQILTTFIIPFALVTAASRVLGEGSK